MKTLPRSFFFFFNDTATTEIYTLSLHDALPIYGPLCYEHLTRAELMLGRPDRADRKSTRLNSSHVSISYAVFCLKKKKDCECMCVAETKDNTMIDVFGWVDV